MSLSVAPIGVKEANRFVHTLHRHNGPLPGAKFCIAAVDEEGWVHGVAIAGAPKARHVDDGLTLEVSRVCTDGTRNCCSFLYGSCKRAAKALGFTRLVTYTLTDEPGTSLKASGWTCDGPVEGATRWGWHTRPGRNYDGAHLSKLRWSIELNPPVPRPKWPEGIQPPPHPELFDDEVAA